MPISKPALWQAIEAHPFKLRSGRTLKTALKAAHGLSDVGAGRLLEEYRRFLYLTALGHARTVPSHQIDAAWHKHLEAGADDYETLTATLGHPLTHTPGRPTGHKDDFRYTLAMYRGEFDDAPPAKIWQRPRRPRLAIPLAILWVLCVTFPFGGEASVVDELQGRFGQYTALVVSAGPVLVALFMVIRPPDIWAALRDDGRRKTGRHDGGSGGGWWSSDGGGDCGGGCGGGD